MSDCCNRNIMEGDICPCDGIDLLDDSQTAPEIQTHPITRRQVLKYMGGFLLTGFIAACGQAGGPQAQKSPVPTSIVSSQPTAPSREGLTKLDLAFCSQVLCILPFEVARQQGYFADEGYDVNLIYMKGGALAINALISKSVDFVGTPMDLIVRSVDQGQPVIMVASTSRLPFFALVVSPGKSSEITKISDLQGKRVGVNNLGTTDDLLLKALLAKNNLDPNSADSVALGPNLYDALLRGEVDAGMVQEPALTLLSQKGARVLVNFMDRQQTNEVLGGDYQFMGLNTRPDVLDSKPDVVEKLARALVKANQWILNHTGSEIVKAAPQELAPGDDIQIFAKALDKYKESLYPSDGVIEEQAVRRVVETQRISGLLKNENIDISTLYTNKYVEG